MPYAKIVAQFLLFVRNCFTMLKLQAILRDGTVGMEMMIETQPEADELRIQDAPGRVEL
jgi:hypothetical protein